MSSGVVSIDKHELERMRRLALPEKGFLNEREERNGLLREKSLAKKKNWPNTLEAIRNKKLNNRREREEQRELEQQEVDRQEAEYRKSMRIEAIRKASEMLYEQNDKMKYLRTQQHYVDVIMDRRRQIASKQEVIDEERKEHQKYHELTMQQVAAANEKEFGLLREKEKLSEYVAKTRAEQFNEVQLRKAAELEEQKQIGLSMKKAAEDRLREDIAAKEKKALEIREGRIKTLEKNAELREERKRMDALDAEAEREREKDIAKADERKKAREDLEKYRFAQAQKTRQKMVDKAVDLLAANKSSEDERVLRQRLEYEDKVLAASDAKEAKARREWDATVQSRLAMVARMRLDEETRKQEGAVIAALMKTRAEEMLEEEQAARRKSRAQTKAVKEALLHDAAERRRQEVEAAIVERERAKLLLALEEEADGKFKRIVKQSIEEYAAQGKPIVTLLKALRFEQPELIPAIVNKAARGKKKDGN